MNPTLLEKLLKDVDVEWKPLGEVGELIRGNGLQKKDLIESGVPAIHYGQIYTYYGLFAETTKSYVSHDLAKRLKKAQCGDILIAGTSENVEDVMKPVGWLGGSIVFSGDMFVFRPNYDVDTKYLTYLLTTKYFFDYKKKHVKGTKVIRMNTEKFLEFLVPIPLLSVQKEIVGILDAFTAHTAELTVELTAELNERKKQYNYYRDKLLTFSDDEVEWKTLSEIANFRRGSFPQPYGLAKWYDGKHSMPFVQVADIDENFNLVLNTARKISRLAQPKSVFVPRGTVIVSLQGSIGRVAVTQYDCYVDRTVGIFENFKIPISKKYFTYQLEKIFSVKKQRARGSTIKTITKEEFSKFKIPFPSSVRQDKIVNTLDQIRKITLSISEGLPREIELRNKQYEYYRDQLLNFPKPENDAIKHNSTNR